MSAARSMVWRSADMVDARGSGTKDRSANVGETYSSRTARYS